jgi:hypothetical protein
MTVLTRLLNYIAIITKVNMDSRPRVVDAETGVFYPISTYDDLKEALEIMKTASLSIRPYQQQWYNNVFLPAFEELGDQPNSKLTEYGHTFERETVVGLTTKHIADKMNEQGLNTSIGNIYDHYIRPLIKQGIINYERSVLNRKENLYYPVNIGDGNGSEDLSISMLPLTEDCRLILNQSFDEKDLLEESFRTIIERRSNGGEVNKYKIIDIDGSGLSLSELLEKYFFNKIHHTSCSVVLQKFHNSTIEHYSIVNDHTKDNSREEKDLTIKKDNVTHDSDENISIDPSYSYECYYCDEFDPTDNRDDYEKHVVLLHDGKLAYPSLIDLDKNNSKPKGKYWEV